MKTLNLYKGTKWKAVLILIILIWLMMPLPQYKPAFSKVLYGDDGSLLAATISSEQQWCFAMDEEIPEKLEKCIILYEDEYIGWHPGINPISIIKSLIINLRERKVVRGASTLAMQVMRMKNKHAARNWPHKIKETLGAVKYSLFHSDRTIIKEWCDIAPFGGNTIGIKAASLRYFGRAVEELSWAEAALLAVMPNSPTSANLSKNREILKRKRNLLLDKLHKKGVMDASELLIYQDEDLPKETNTLPQNAYHALQFLAQKYPTQYIFNSTISTALQLKTQDLLETESAFLKMDDIRNISAIVIDISSNQLLSYIGNIKNEKGKFSYVDIVQAPRSYGSLLKPLLYAHALQTSYLLPQELVADIPTIIGEFQPENFDKKYRGVVPFDEMIIQSLNVPAVRVLNTIGLQSFYDVIQRLDIHHLNKGANHYGLSIILGGGESTLWEMSRIYKGLAQNYMGRPDPFRQVQILKNIQDQKQKNSYRFSAQTMDYLVKAMSDLTRPREEKSWEYFGTHHKIAWKTGTSYGHKDAWAIGFNGKYMVGVWVGNEGGEGRHDLTGITRAAPVMFKLFNILPQNQWFAKPPTYSVKHTISVCRESGKLAGHLCKSVKKMMTEHTSLKLQSCQYHQSIMLNDKGQMLSENCENEVEMRDTIFVLPSYLEYFYKQSHFEYKGLPLYDPKCSQEMTEACKIIYPNNGLKIFLPKEKTATINDLVVKAYHRDPRATLFWFLDDVHVKNSENGQNEIMLKVSKGSHTITINDPLGNSDAVTFEILTHQQ